MDPIVTVHTADSQPTSSLLVPQLPPPTLRPSERYHVFMRYSSTDKHWAHSIIHQLELCGLQVCYHERDFIPGRTVLENMSDCIQESQKVLLALSPEFVRSRWCLLEANMSLFRGCLERKPIIPVLLDTDVAVPLHLCHLTYLEASDRDFMNKVLKVLCTPNQQLQGSTVVPFHPPSLYDGKALQHLIAVNEESLNKWDCGHFNDMIVPDQLQLIIRDQEKYREAIRKVNCVSENRAWLYSKNCYILLAITFMFLGCLICGMITSVICLRMINYYWSEVPLEVLIVSLFSIFLPSAGLNSTLSLWKKRAAEDGVREMQKAIGQANIILIEEKVKMGCVSNSEIYLVYVSLDGCQQEFEETFSEEGTADDMFHRALLYFSSGYACCLAKKHFPPITVSTKSHLEGSVCFCQYVSQQLSTDNWE